MYIYIYVYTYMYIYTHVYIRVYIYMNIRVYIYTYGDPGIERCIINTDKRHVQLLYIRPCNALEAACFV